MASGGGGGGGGGNGGGGSGGGGGGGNVDPALDKVAPGTTLKLSASGTIPGPITLSGTGTDGTGTDGCAGTDGRAHRAAGNQRR